MSSASDPVSVRILDREYTVGVGADGRDALMAAARLVDSRMREIRGSNRMAAVDRVAVLTALNLAHELEQLRGRDAEMEQVLDAMERSLDALPDS